MKWKNEEEKKNKIEGNNKQKAEIKLYNEEENRKEKMNKK